MQAKLINQVSLDEIGSPVELFFVPARPGSQAQFVWLESMGIFMSRIFLNAWRGEESAGIKRVVAQLLRWLRIPYAYRFRHLRKEKFGLFCMTRTDAGARILWQGGQRSEYPYYCSHMGESLLRIADINGDGRDEIVAVCGPGRIGVFDYDTGALVQETRLPSDNFSTIRLAKTGPRPDDWSILTATSDAGYPPHTYSNPTLLLDSRLRVLAEYDLSAGAGHTPVVFDADGDGFDEFLVGYTLIDHNGKITWVAEGFEDPSAINAARMHADHIVVIDPDKSGRWRAAVAGSNRLYLFDANGRKLWDHQGEHPQYLFYGRINPQNQDPHLFLLNCRISMELLDLQGNCLWKGRLPANWPLGRPKAVRGDDRFHMGIPGTLWRNPDKQGHDIIIYNEAGFPYGIDGFGNRVLEFPCPPSSGQPEYPIPAQHRPDDYGYGYRTLVEDIDGDGQPEVVVHDRRFAWTYRLLE